MFDLLLIVLGLVWFGGAALRVYLQARFYQIEEYMSLRYLRWLFAKRTRWLPTRPAVAWLIGMIMALTLAESPGSALPILLCLIAAGIAIYPPNEGEIKKKFRPTARAKRLLGTAFVIIILAGLSIGIFFNRLEMSEQFAPLIVSTLGFGVFLIAPLLLIIANTLMSPVEAAMRARFINQARQTLADVNPTVIGITGSYGKTTTKTILTHILNGRYRAYPTPKSYNTLMGVCLAINNDLSNNRSIDYFIAEMGAYIPGEIAEICDLTHPRMSIVVEVGPQHLERFGSIENIAAAKYEIIKALPPDGVGVFNWDNPYIRQMVERGYPQTRLTVSKTADPTAVQGGIPRFVASDVAESLDGLGFTVTDTVSGTSESFITPLIGEHNVTNILLATAAAINEGMSLKEVAFRVRTLRQAESRLVRNVTPEGITIINDAYSANPVGIIYALRVLSLHQTGRRLLITPGMVELGTLMESENRKLGALAAQHATDVILVGKEQVEPIRQGLLDAGFPQDHLHIMPTLAESIEWYRRNLKPGDSVLFLNDLPDTYTS